MIEFLQSYPWILPGSVLALVVALLGARPATAWLGVTRPIAALMIFNVGVMLALTLTPAGCRCPTEAGTVHGCDLSRIGLASLSAVLGPTDVTGNVMALLPLGFAIAKVPRSRRRWTLLALAIAMPFAIEVTQLLVVALGRACEGADIVDNLTGLAVGFAAGAGSSRIVSRLRTQELLGGDPVGRDVIRYRGAVTTDPDREALEAALAGRGDHELFPCDPALADTAAFCAAYGFAPEDSANTIVVVGKGSPPVYAACVVLATHRLDVNRAVKQRFGRKSSFANPDETRAITGHEIGGVTVFGLPADLPVWVDAAVMTRERIVLGGGSRSWKVIAPPSILRTLPNVEVVEGLANPAPPRDPSD